MKYRVKPYFTLDGFSGGPKNEYRVEYRKMFKWYAVENLQPFENREQAEAEMYRLKL